MSLTINAVKYFTLGGVTSAWRGWGIQLETEPCFDKENQPKLLHRQRSWLRQMSHSLLNWLLNTGYILSTLSLLQEVEHASGICLSSASWNSILLHSASLWSSTPIWYLCCVVTPAEKILGFVQMMDNCAHLDYLKLITFLMESSHLAELLQLHFSGIWFLCKWSNIIHQKLRCETSSSPLEQKMSSYFKLLT